MWPVAERGDAMTPEPGVMTVEQGAEIIRAGYFVIFALCLRLL